MYTSVLADSLPLACDEPHDDIARQLWLGLADWSWKKTAHTKGTVKAFLCQLGTYPAGVNWISKGLF